MLSLGKRTKRYGLRPRRVSESDVARINRNDWVHKFINAEAPLPKRGESLITTRGGWACEFDEMPTGDPKVRPLMYIGCPFEAVDDKGCNYFRFCVQVYNDKDGRGTWWKRAEAVFSEYAHLQIYEKSELEKTLN